MFDRDIYFSELKPFIHSDSAAMATAYINKIIQEEALIRKAQESGGIPMDDIDARTLQFKNSLIILKYQNEYLKKNLDTVVSEQMLKTYYDQNPHSFKLFDDIFKGYFIRIPGNTPKIEKLKALMLGRKPSDLQEMKTFCLRYANTFLINSEVWGEFPQNAEDRKYINNENVQHYIRNKQVLTYEKEDHLYLVRLFDFKFARQQSPYDFCKPEIKMLILNKRKMQAWAKFNEQVLEEAKSNQNVEIYP